MKKKTISSSVFIFISLLALAGCSTSKITVKPDFWQSKGHTIGVAMMVAPHAGLYGLQQGGLVVAIIQELEWGSLVTCLNTMDTASFYDLRDQVVEQLSQRGMHAKKITEPLAEKDFRIFNNTIGHIGYRLDMRPLAETDSIDELVLFEVESWGAVDHHNLFSADRVCGVCTMKGYLINLDDNRMQWRAIFDGDEAQVETDGEWDQAPDYPNLTKAVEKAVAKAKERLKGDFFGEGK